MGNGIRYVEGCPQGEDVLFLNEVMLLSKSLSLVDDAYYNYHRREDSANSRDLSSGEIRAGVETRERIVDNILSAGDVVDDAGKRFVFSFCFKSVLTYACRSSDQASLHYCIDKAFALYGRVSPWLSESDMMVLPVVLPFFKAGDRGGLFAFMCKNRTEQKIMCANLRYLQEQRKHQSQKGE